VRPSPLAEVHEELGATLTEFAGWQLPVRFTSDLQEHHAVRSAAGLFDLSHMSQFVLTGPQVAGALDRALTASHSTMTRGQAAYSLLLADDGGTLDDLIVYRLMDQQWVIIGNAANWVTVARELTARMPRSGAALDDLTASYSLIAIQGPASAAILSELDLGELATTMPYYSIATGRVPTPGGKIVALIARTGYTGEDGFELMVGAGQAVAVWRAIEQAGKDHGLVPAGLACRDTLRLEAGMPLYGHELTRETTPLEAGLGRFVALEKTPFVGSKALQDNPPRQRLIALAGQGRRAARAGYRVLIEGEERGFVTSGALSPTLGHPIALAYVDLPAPDQGTEVEIDVRGTLQPYTVVKRPFYRRPASS